MDVDQVGFEDSLSFSFEPFLAEQDARVSEHYSEDICKFYLRGLCLKGDKCDMRHSKCVWTGSSQHVICLC